MKDIKIFLEKKKKKSDSMVVNVTKIFQEMKNKSLSSIEKDKRALNEKKGFIMVIRKYLHLENWLL